MPLASLSLTERDELVLVALSHQVRVLTMDDLVRTFFGEGRAVERYGRARVGALASAGLLAVGELLARPVPVLSEPVIDWRPGWEVEPDFGKASYRLKQRWTEPPRSTTVVSATKEASRMTGESAEGSIDPLGIYPIADCRCVGVADVFRSRLDAGPGPETEPKYDS